MESESRLGLGTSPMILQFSVQVVEYVKGVVNGSIETVTPVVGQKASGDTV